MNMRVIDQNTITDAALEQMASTKDARLKEVMDSLVRHLHSFAREVDLKPEEWLEGIKFLTAVGQKCTPFRQEFILLSDMLGFSSLVNALHDQRAAGSGTKSSLLGPFYRQDSPPRKLGDSIASNSKSAEIGIYGRVLDSAGAPIPNASLEVWQPDDEGWYDMQKSESQMDLRGRFVTDSQGGYYLRTIAPTGYMVPMDGPVGDLILRQGRHGYRPAHIHFVVGAEGYREVVTALYLTGDPHIESDTVFGVSQSLVVRINGGDSSSPFPALPSIKFDFQLAAAEQGTSGRVGADPAQILKGD
jgi:protocatechuate 3,4-dioxygenase beta subunit